ncbi:hypothetical protein [Segatella copri]|uniref:hypothetical protein n=1 Tax=Segatella copri TaxID=165179 RepID=UPI00223116DF|nr:hypothetical protein [Segatella copri]MCW4081069.1 hypothetical protein [Segatella copri]
MISEQTSMPPYCGTFAYTHRSTSYAFTLNPSMTFSIRADFKNVGSMVMELYL